MEALWHGLALALQPIYLGYALVGVVAGTLVGVLPGIGPAGAIAILLPATFKLDAAGALILLTGLYYGTQYGGSTTSILLNIPGEASSVVTCLDGFKMAQAGRAGPALGMAAFASFIAGTIGIVGLMLLAPTLAAFALRFGPPEYFSLMVLGLVLAASLGTTSTLKSITMAVLGLAMGTVGLDPVLGTPRFTFGTLTLQDGIGLIPVAIGVFGIAEVLFLAEQAVSPPPVPARPRGLLPTRQDWRDSGWPITRGSLLGFLIGVLPGAGPVIASFAAYAVERRVQGPRSRLGTGMIEGVAAPEAANNAAAVGNFVPLLTLGIPANVIMALFLGASMIHGIIPGPLLFERHADVFWGLVASMYVSNLLLLLLNLPLIGMFVQVLRIPVPRLAPLIVLFAIVGVYSTSSNAVDVFVMGVLGVFGYLCRKFGFEPAPLLLALVLGPRMEETFNQSLLMFAQEGLSIFVLRPLSAALLLLAGGLVAMGIVRRRPPALDAPLPAPTGSPEQRSVP